MTFVLHPEAEQVILASERVLILGAGAISRGDARGLGVTIRV